MMSGQREPFFNFTEPVPVFFAGFLVLVFLVDWLLPGTVQPLKILSVLYAENGNVLIDRDGASSLWSLVLHTLFHGGLTHIFINSLMICVFGVLICRVAGSGPRGALKFFTIFLAGAIFGGLAQWAYWSAMGATGAALGASSGASALLAAAGWVVGGRQTMGQWGLGWLVINIAMLAFNALGTPMQIAWAAHLGGYVGGALIAPFLLPPSSTPFRVTR